MSLSHRFRRELNKCHVKASMVHGKYVIVLDGIGYSLDQIPKGKVRTCYAAGLTQTQFEQLCANVSPTLIEFKNLLAHDFSAIAQMENLIGLSLLHCPMFTQLNGVERLSKLEYCSLNTCMKLVELDHLTDLPIRHLRIAGGMSKPLWLETLLPLSKMYQLEELSFANVKIRSGGLAPLAKIVSLKHLSLPSFFPKEEYDALHRQRPDITGNVAPFQRRRNTFLKRLRLGYEALIARVTPFT
tara:strand:- start:218 stop:943 length:726 start_codon:yes stop_codon:yes gene_type:complete